MQLSLITADIFNPQMKMIYFSWQTFWGFQQRRVVHYLICLLLLFSMSWKEKSSPLYVIKTSKVFLTTTTLEVIEFNTLYMHAKYKQGTWLNFKRNEENCHGYLIQTHQSQIHYRQTNSWNCPTRIDIIFYSGLVFPKEYRLLFLNKRTILENNHQT